MANRKFYQKKRIMIPLTIGSALIFLGIFGALHSSMYQTTTNAYVDDYLIKVTPQISSKIIELNVENASVVKKGEILVELDGSKYKNEVQKLEEKFEQIHNELNLFNFEIGKMKAQATLAKDNIEQAKLDLENANSDYIRYKNEFKDGTVTKKDLDNAIHNLEIAKENYEKTQESLKTTSVDLIEVISKKDNQMDNAQEILEDLQKAKLELSSATIIAPKNGKIINLNTKIGDVVDNDKVMFTIVPDECYIIANFKKLPKTNLKIGQKANVKIYTAALKRFNGEIVEMLPQKQNVVSLKIKITDSIEKYNIKSGAKAFVKIKTQ